MNGDGVELRLIRELPHRPNEQKIIRRWVAPIPPDDREALTRAFVDAVRAVTGARTDIEADAFIRDYRMEFYARVGGWTRFTPPPTRRRRWWR